jgi:hypothetical protein
VGGILLTMANLYTMNGRPLTRRGDDLFTRFGNHIGRVQGEKVFGPDGRYVGTLVGDRLVYRSIDSAHVSSAFGRQAGAASSSANAAASAVWGEEPTIPD